MTAIPLYVVTLYPYDDGSEARYQFATLDEAQAFADMVNDLPKSTLAYINGSGLPGPVSPWVSGTYESPEAAMKALREWITDEDPDAPDDGKTLIAGVLYDRETGMEADPQ
jgi:hypothetical protein